ncbi:MAG TPA: protein-methionine-sulfoxide reductase heme-binding subunit MsrQ [Steroidobacteraceae bacterium]|nr:protein-methionine-sulfoxide reductase heme-binding subunit MsrQ [Steroidobacteraceae bacterium]
MAGIPEASRSLPAGGGPRWPLRWLVKPLVFAACLLPAMRLTAGAVGFAGVSLGADPVAAMLHTCGKWTLNFLMITLCMTPLRDATRSVFWLKLRRMFGLFAFFYVLLHLTVYLVLDQAGKLSALWEDIVKRPYITIGMLGLCLLIPLAVTSTAKAQRRLGRGWIKLHRLVYAVAILGVWHYWWGVKKDVREPLLYVCGLSLLLGYRLWKHRRGTASRFSVARVARTDAS